MTSREYNQICIETLTRLNFASRIAVIGSGLSYPVVPNIEELSASMERRCAVKKEDREPYWDYFDRAYTNNPEEYFEILKISFGTTAPADARAYWHIANIPFNGLVTLNVDDQLPSACEKAKTNGTDFRFKVFPGQPIFLPSDFSLDKRCLVAVHGYKNETDPNWYKKLILRKGDYEQYYYRQRGNPPPFLYLWWYWLLTTWPCAFIGTSLQEPGLAAVMVGILESGNHAMINQHIHLKQTSGNPPDYVDNDARSLGVIQPVYYDRIDEHHSGLNQILAHFSNKPCTSPVPMPETRVNTIENNFDFLQSHGNKLKS